MKAIRPRTMWRYGLYGFLMTLLAVFLIYPVILTVSGAFWVDVDGDGQKAFSLSYILGDGVGVLRNPLYRQGLINSFLIAVFTTVICWILTLPLAVLASRFKFPGKTLATSLIMVPLILPPFVGAIGMRALLGRFGTINSLLASVGILDPNQPGIDWLGGEIGGRFWAVVIMQALHLYPIMYLNVSAAMANLDPTLDEAAENLGASRWRRLFRITLPLILPGLFAGSTIVFIWSFTELGTPLMFDYYTVTPVQIFWEIQEVANNPRPYALVVVMMAAALVFYLIGKFTFGGRGHEMMSKASIASTEKKLSGLAGWSVTAAFLGLTFIAVLPHIGVVMSALSAQGAWYRTVLPSDWTLEHFDSALSHDLAMGSIVNSLKYASLAMILCIIVGLAISYLTVRVRVWGGWMLDSLAMLPLAVPGLVMAFGYVAMSVSWPFQEGQPLGGLFDVVGQNPNPMTLLVIAYAVRRLPYVVRSVSAGLEQTSGQLEEAALNLGASPLMAIRRIVMPLIMANIIAGGLLAFSFAMLEVSDSLILAQREQDFPITKAIYAFFERLGDGPYIASAMGVWGMALLTVTLVGASVLMGKKLGAIFRV